LLHQVPLTLLYWYNDDKLDKPEYSLDSAFLIGSIVHMTWVFFEMTILRGYLNAGVNLE
jgi:hypothetical protein